MYSFYGGKQGFSFTLVESFESIAAMVEKFKLGSEYTTVHYNEYVLINTLNKNNPDNGKIFRRGCDYSNDMGGAIYIGTIVGPAGKAPMLELTTIEKVLEKQAEENYEIRKGEGSYSPVGENIIPGKTEEGLFNDEIKWAYCSVRDANNEDTVAYIGFKIPYLVVDFSAEAIDSYSNLDQIIERTDDKTHPFYEKWNLKIPKGIKGDTIKNFRVIPADETVEDYDGKIDDVSSQREILVYDYYNYDESKEGRKTTLYLGDYNMIEEINLNEDGSIVVGYTHQDDDTFNKAIKWIKSVTLDENGHFTVLYNHDTDKNGSPTIYETNLKWVKDIDLSNAGKITLIFSTGEMKELSYSIKWIDRVDLESTGTLTVHYNDGTTNIFENKIQWIENISLSEDGQFSIRYNNGTPEYRTILKWVKDIIVEENGNVSILYNNGDPVTHNNYLKTIRDISVETQKDNNGDPASGDQKIHIIYNTGETAIIGEPLNYILETTITPDYHYLVYYSSPDKRQKIVESGLNYNYKGKNDWLDLGSIKEDSGVLVGLNISLEENPTLSDMTVAIQYLNNNYPTGLKGLDLEGKIVTIGSAKENKSFYAFDYSLKSGNYKGWYYLGSFNMDISNILMIGKETDEDIESKKMKISPGGLWFIVED